MWSGRCSPSFYFKSNGEWFLRLAQLFAHSDTCIDTNIAALILHMLSPARCVPIYGASKTFIYKTLASSQKIASNDYGHLHSPSSPLFFVHCFIYECILLFRNDRLQNVRSFLRHSGVAMDHVFSFSRTHANCCADHPGTYRPHKITISLNYEMVHNKCIKWK